MSANLGKAFIEVEADASGLAASISRSLDGAFRDLDKVTDRALRGLEDAFDSGGQEAGDAFVDGFRDAADDIKQQLDGIGDTADGKEIAAAFDRATEDIEDSFKEMARTADTQFGKVEADAERSSKGARDSFLRFAKVAAGAFAAVQVGQFFGRATTAAAEFDTQMREVTTLLSAEQLGSLGGFDELSGQVNDFAKEFGTLPAEVVPSLYQAISAGVPTDNVFSFLEVAQQAAIGGVTDLETAVDGISSVVNAYGSDVIGAAEASDLMFTAVRLGKTTFDELSASLFQVTPIAAGLGVNFEDVSASLAALTAQGVPTAQAATSMKAALAELGKEGTAADKSFQSLAGQSFQEFIAGGGNVSEAFNLMREGADDMGTSVANLFGSVEAGTAVLALTSNTGFADAIAAMGELADATAIAFAKIDESPARAIERLQAAAQVLVGDLGRALLPAIDALLPVVTDLVDTLGPVFATVLRDVVTALAPVIQSLASNLAPILGVVAEVVGGLLEVLGPVFTTVLDALLPVLLPIVQVFADLLPVLAPLATLFGDLLVGALTSLAPLFDALAPVLVTIVGVFIDALLPVLPALVDAFLALVDAAVQLVIPLLPLITLTAQLAGLLVGAGLVPVIVAIADAFQFVADVLAPVAEFLGALFEPLELLSEFTLDEFVEAMAEGLETVLDAVGGFVENAVGFFTALPGQIVRGLARFGATLARLFARAFATLGRAILSGIGTLVGFWVTLPLRIAGALVTLPIVLVSAIAGAFEAVGTAIGVGAANAVQFFLDLPGRIVAGLSTLGTTIAGVFSSAFDAVTSTIGNFIEGAVDFFAKLPGRIVSLVGAMASAGASFIGGLLSGIGNALGNAAGFATDVAKNIANALIGMVNRAVILPFNNFRVVVDPPGPIPKFTLDFPNLPAIPALAMGGITTGPTMALIGEAGREAVVPFTRSKQMDELALSITSALSRTADTGAMATLLSPSLGPSVQVDAPMLTNRVTVVPAEVIAALSAPVQSKTIAPNITINEVGDARLTAAAVANRIAIAAKG